MVRGLGSEVQRRRWGLDPLERHFLMSLGGWSGGRGIQGDCGKFGLAPAGSAGTMLSRSSRAG